MITAFVQLVATGDYIGEIWRAFGIEEDHPLISVAIALHEMIASIGSER